MNDSSSAVPQFESELFRNTPIILEVYDFFKLFHEILTKFPKCEKHSLGIEIEKDILQILKQLMVCSASEPAIKKTKLPETSVNLDLLKVLIRLCYDTKSIDLKAYIRLQEKLQKIGRMLGGWIRSLK
jgi:hypothetical protein